MALVRHDPCNLHHPPPYLSHPPPQARLHPLPLVPLANQSRLLAALAVLARLVGGSPLRLATPGVAVRLEMRALVARLVVRGRVVVPLDSRQASSSRPPLEAAPVSLESHRVQVLVVSQIALMFLFPL